MSILSARSLTNVLFPSGSENGTLVMLTAYFDDSGTDAGSPIVVYAGLIGKKYQWVGLENAWRRKLQKPLPGKPPLKRFHMAPCMAQKGKDFSIYNSFEAKILADDFTQIIIDAGLFAYGCAVLKDDWSRLVTGDMLRALGDAERYCVANCMLISSEIARKATFEKEIAWVFDNRPHRENENYKVFRIFDEFHKQRLVKRPKPTIAFGSSEDLLPLQAADIIAWELFNSAKVVQKTGKAEGNKHLGRLNKFLAKKLLRVQFADGEDIPKIVEVTSSRGNERLKGIGDLMDSHSREGVE